MKHVLKISARFACNYLFIGGRRMPSFLIIGAQKGGTSSLFEYLLEHPDVQGSFIKEVQYFTRRHWIGVRGYRAFFPQIRNTTRHVGESTPYYLFSPEAPTRVHSLLPDVKLIALLREPVERAYSHYTHNCRRGHETRSFEQCVAEDIRRAKSAGGPGRVMGESEDTFRHHSYVRRGLYADQLDRWISLFPRENIKLLRAEDLFADPAGITAETFEFLGLSRQAINTDTAHNQFAYAKKRREEFQDLSEFFREPNERLFDLTGIRWQAMD